MAKVNGGSAEKGFLQSILPALEAWLGVTAASACFISLFFTIATLYEYSVHGAWFLDLAVPLGEFLAGFRRIGIAELLPLKAQDILIRIAFVFLFLLLYAIVSSITPGATLEDVLRNLRSNRIFKACLIVATGGLVIGLCLGPSIKLFIRGYGPAGFLAIFQLGYGIPCLLRGGLDPGVTLPLALSMAAFAVLVYCMCFCTLTAYRVLSEASALKASLAIACLVFACGLPVAALLLALLSLRRSLRRNAKHLVGVISSVAFYTGLAVAPRLYTLLVLALPINAYIAAYGGLGTLRFSKEKLGVDIVGFIAGSR